MYLGPTSVFVLLWELGIGEAETEDGSLVAWTTGGEGPTYKPQKERHEVEQTLTCKHTCTTQRSDQSSWTQSVVLQLTLERVFLARASWACLRSIGRSVLLPVHLFVLRKWTIVVNMAGIGIRMKSDSGRRQSVFSVSKVIPGKDTFPWEEEEDWVVVTELELVVAMVPKVDGVGETDTLLLLSVVEDVDGCGTVWVELVEDGKLVKTLDVVAKDAVRAWMGWKQANIMNKQTAWRKVS